MASETKWVPLGKVLREWGLRGGVKCLCFNPESELFAEVSELFLETSQGYQPFQIESIRRHDKFWRIHFKGYNSPERAKQLRSCLIALPRENLPEIQVDEFYLSDLEGISVFGPDGHGLGCVQGIQQIGDSDMLMIGSDKKEVYLVPFEDDFIVETSIPAGKIILSELGVELIDINRLPSSQRKRE